MQRDSCHTMWRGHSHPGLHLLPHTRVAADVPHVRLRHALVQDLKKLPGGQVSLFWGLLLRSGCCFASRDTGTGVTDLLVTGAGHVRTAPSSSGMPESRQRARYAARDLQWQFACLHAQTSATHSLMSD